MKPKSPALYKRRAEIIRALGHPSRLLVADALSHGELCVCELTDLVRADMSTVSKHLSVMKAAGLVHMEKRGQNVYYRLACPCLNDFFNCVDSIQRSHAKQLQAACCPA